MEAADMSQIADGTDTDPASPPPIIAEAAPLTTPIKVPPELETNQSSPTLKKHHTEFASFEEAYIARYIALADTKASFVFAGASAVLVYLFNKDEIRAIAKNPAWSPSCVLLYIGIWFLIIAAVYAFATIMPRLTTSGDGVVYFGSVASHSSARDYRSAVASMSESDFSTARITHCYDLARVCQRKYAALRRAMMSLPVGIGVTVCVALLVD